jgi:hypothetical protein
VEIVAAKEDTALVLPRRLDFDIVVPGVANSGPAKALTAASLLDICAVELNPSSVLISLKLICPEGVGIFILN